MSTPQPPPEPLPLAIYAVALAHLLHRRGEPPAAVLGALNLTAEAFRQADRYWNGHLARSFTDRKGLLAMKFGAAFAQARAELGLLDPRIGETTSPGLSAPASSELPSYLLRDWSAMPAGPGAPVAASAPSAALPGAHRLAGTMMFSGEEGTAKLPLPFSSGAPGGAPAPPPASPQGAPATRLPTGTAFLADGPPSAAATTPWDALPLAPSPEGLPPLPKMSLEHYAALSAELGRSPHDAAAILVRYGIQAPEEHARIDAAFRAHLAADPALRARCGALFRRMTAMMQG